MHCPPILHTHANCSGARRFGKMGAMCRLGSTPHSVAIGEGQSEGGVPSSRSQAIERSRLAPRERQDQAGIQCCLKGPQLLCISKGHET